MMTNGMTGVLSPTVASLSVDGNDGDDSASGEENGGEQNDRYPTDPLKDKLVQFLAQLGSEFRAEDKRAAFVQLLFRSIDFRCHPFNSTV
jgi:hypothetical protein